MPGIPYWKEKIAIMQKLTETRTYTGLVRRVVIDAEFGTRLAATKDDVLRSQIKADAETKAALICDNLRHWFKSTPRDDTAEEFFDPLIEWLECDRGRTNAPLLIQATVDQFIRFLPEKHHDIARAALAVGTDTIEGSGPTSSRSGSGPFPTVGGLLEPLRRIRPIVADYELLARTMRHTGVRERKINQPHFYLTPDAAVTWRDLVNSAGYPTYDQCQTGLNRLAESSEFAAEITSHPPAVLMLGGGGAPTKDLTLMRAICTHLKDDEPEPSYYIVDISPYMLVDTITWLNMHTPPDCERVRVTPVWADMMALGSGVCREIFGGETRKLFVIAGGTIGNVSERAFFESVNRVAHTNDLMVVSAETFDEGDLSETKTILRQKYDHADMQRFISPAVRILLDEERRPEAVLSALKRTIIEVVEGGHGGSDVPGSISVVLSWEAKVGRVILLSSTRYLETPFTTFASQHGWILISTTRSPLNPRFLQFFFRRR